MCAHSALPCVLLLLSRMQRPLFCYIKDGKQPRMVPDAFTTGACQQGRLRKQMS